MSAVGLLIALAVLGAVICVKTRSAAGAVVFSLIALVLFVGTPVGQAVPGAVGKVMSTVDQATTPTLNGAAADVGSAVSVLDRGGALMAARARCLGGPAGGGVAGRPRELDRAALSVQGACGVALRPDCVRPWSTEPRRPAGARGAVEAESASTHRPGPDQPPVLGGVSGGGAGLVGRPGPVSPLHVQERADDVSREWRDWRGWAACRDHEPDLFFPTDTTGRAYEAQVTAAKAVCAGCPVRGACLAEALESIPEGIAGGLTEQERRALRGGGGRRGRRRARLELARETATTGRRLLATGCSPRVAASRCGVSVRTAQRWAASMPETTTAAGAAS